MAELASVRWKTTSSHEEGWYVVGTSTQTSLLAKTVKLVGVEVEEIS